MRFVVDDYKTNIFNGKIEGGVSTTRNISEPRRNIPTMKFNNGFDLPQSSMRIDPVHSKFQSIVDKYAKEPASFSKSFFSPQAS